MCNFYLLDSGRQSGATKCLKLYFIRLIKKQWSADCGSVLARVGHQISQYHTSLFLWEREKTSLTQDAHYCVVMIALSLSLFSVPPGEKNIHTHTQPMGTSLQRRSLEENNADLSSSHCGSTGNNKSGCGLCWEPEPGGWYQQRLNSNYKRHNKTHLLHEIQGYICINQCHTEFKYIKQY